MDYASMATGLATTATSAIGAAAPVIIVVLGATIGYRLFKRFVK